MRKRLLSFAGFCCLAVGLSGLHAQTETKEIARVYEMSADEIDVFFGATAYGVSENGDYVVGHDNSFAYQAFIWERKTGKFKHITGAPHKDQAAAYGVTNDGMVVGAFAKYDSTKLGRYFLPGYWKDGEWTALPLEEGVPLLGGDENGYAQAVSPDGRIITGYIKTVLYSEKLKKDIRRNRPCTWIEGVLQPAHESWPGADLTGSAGVFVSHASDDGKVIGGVYEHPRGTRAPVVLVDGEIIFMYGEKDIDPDIDEYFFDGAIGGVSHNGKYVGGYFSETGDATGPTIAFIYNTETKEKKEITDMASPTVMMDDGSYFGMGGNVSFHKGDFNGSYRTYLENNYKTDFEEAILPATILCASADGKVVAGWYGADAGFGPGMLPSIISIEPEGDVSVEWIDATKKALYCNRDEIVAEGAERIELYDISGCKLNSVAASQISVNEVSGVVIAKVYYANGETRHAKFVIR